MLLEIMLCLPWVLQGILLTLTTVSFSQNLSTSFHLLCLSTQLVQHLFPPAATSMEELYYYDFDINPFLLMDVNPLLLTCQNHHFVLLVCAPQQLSVAKQKLSQKISTKSLLLHVITCYYATTSPKQPPPTNGISKSNFFTPP